MSEVKNIKIGTNNPDSIMIDKYRKDVIVEAKWSWLKWANDAGGYFVHGLTILPFTAWGAYTWPWDLSVPGGALKDDNHGWARWGYVNDGYGKNLTQGMNKNFPNNDGGTTCGVCICICNETVETKGIDLGDVPIVIDFLDDRFDDASWAITSGCDVTIKNRKITIKKVGAVSRGMVCKAFWSDTSIDNVRNKMVNIYADVKGLTYHKNTLIEGDVTSAEVWKAYCGNEVIYNKDKTFENCWKKYGLVYPNNYNIFKYNCTTDPNVEWQSPTKFKILDTIVDSSIRYGNQSNNANYWSISGIAFDIIIKNKPSDVTATLERVVGNSTSANDSVYIELDNGLNNIPAYSKTVYRSDPSTPITFTEVKIFVTGSVSVDNMTVELVPKFENSSLFKINGKIWEFLFNRHIVPVIKDINDYIPVTKFNIYVNNSEFWDVVKYWYENNIGCNSNFRNGKVFFESGGLTDITIKLPNDSYQHGEDNFAGSSIETITFVQTGKLSHFSAPQRLLRSAWNLRTINIQWYNDEPGWLCGANTIADGMSCGLFTYPERFINWGAQRSNTFNNTIPCTLFQYAFNNASNLVEIPSYPGTEDENTIIPASYVENAFNGCSKLTVVGPILDLIVVKPGSAANIFNNCSVLSHIRIKNLNHGNWNFDNVSRNGIKHGTLAALDAECVKYLFDNLSDLTTSDPARHVETIDNSFKNWTSDYFNGSYYTPDYDYTLSHVTRFNCRKRYATADEAVYIASTTRKLTEMQIRITGMQSGDKVIFGATGSVPLYEITANGVYSITKETTTTMGFKLVNENTDLRSDVVIGIENGLDYTNPVVSSASIYCPAEWEDKITDDMVSNANAKGWFIYINNVLKEI